MTKLLRTGFIALVALALAGPAFAQNDRSGDEGGLGADEGVAGAIILSRSASTMYHAERFRCTDPTATSTIISTETIDCCVAGDIWRSTIFKGLAQKRFNSTANVGPNPGDPAFAPGVPSPAATIAAAVKNVDLVNTLGNNVPCCLGAGYSVRVTTNGGNAACALRQQKP